MKTFKVEFTVRGCGDFPHDMLRFDGAVAAGPSDAAKIDWKYGDPAPKGSSPLYRRDVNLVMQAPSRYAGPTTARWESFLWKVVSSSHQP